jgi:hypothetical protein
VCPTKVSRPCRSRKNITQKASVWLHCTRIAHVSDHRHTLLTFRYNSRPAHLAKSILGNPRALSNKPILSEALVSTAIYFYISCGLGSSSRSGSRSRQLQFPVEFRQQFEVPAIEKQTPKENQIPAQRKNYSSIC